MKYIFCFLACIPLALAADQKNINIPMDYVIWIMGGFFLVIGYFLKQVFTTIKQNAKEIETIKYKMASYNNDKKLDRLIKLLEDNAICHSVRK